MKTKPLSKKLYTYNVGITEIKLTPTPNGGAHWQRYHCIQSNTELSEAQLTNAVKNLELDVKVDQPDAYTGDCEVLEYNYYVTITDHELKYVTV